MIMRSQKKHQEEKKNKILRKILFIKFKMLLLFLIRLRTLRNAKYLEKSQMRNFSFPLEETSTFGNQHTKEWGYIGRRT